MITKSNPVHISRTLIDNTMWNVERYLMDRYGVDQAAQDMAPLRWYIGTGRASIDFIRGMIVARPYMVARKLHQGGSYDEVIERLKEYLN